MASFQFVKPVVPHFAEWFNKIGYFFQFSCMDVIVNFPTQMFLQKFLIELANIYQTSRVQA
jgi:hypothetical protein